ncbi:hypothetical protein ACIRP0_30625 [Streptomyces sp. NPDC101733]
MRDDDGGRRDLIEVSTAAVVVVRAELPATGVGAGYGGGRADSTEPPR